MFKLQEKEQFIDYWISIYNYIKKKVEKALILNILMLDHDHCKGFLGPKNQTSRTQTILEKEPK